SKRRSTRACACSRMVRSKCMAGPDCKSVCHRVGDDALVQRQMIEGARAEQREVVEIVTDEIDMIPLGALQQRASRRNGGCEGDDTVVLAAHAGPRCERERLRGLRRMSAADPCDLAVMNVGIVCAPRIDSSRAFLRQIVNGVDREDAA